MTPEERARETIDELLRYAGWHVQDREAMNLYDPTRPGVALREAHLQTGYTDYLLFMDGKALSVFDAYGWPHDLTDEEILERLLALNLERAVEEEKVNG